MKKLFKRIILFSCFIIIYKLVLLAIVFLTYSKVKSNKFIGTNTKKSKIVLVGASNIEHNFDFEVLNRRFIDYDVIGSNLSEPSGLYAIYYKLRKLELNEKDVIVFCLPHSLYESEKFLPLKSYKKQGFSKDLLKDAFNEFPLEFFKHSFFDIKIKDAYNLIEFKGFNKEPELKEILFTGNPEIQADVHYKECWTNNRDMFSIKSTGFDKDYLNKIFAFVHKKVKAKIFFRYPVLKEDSYSIDENRLLFIRDKVHFINDFDTSIYKGEYFFDQWYHLNNCGRDLNTEKLTSELKNVL